MDQALRPSDGIELSLELIEYEMNNLIQNNKISLDFNKKSWAACPEGQRLLFMTNIVSELREIVKKLKEHDL